MNRNVKYQGLSISVPLIKLIKNYIKQNPQYTSVTDFIKTAIREKLAKGDR